MDFWAWITNPNFRVNHQSQSGSWKVAILGGASTRPKNLRGQKRSTPSVKSDLKLTQVEQKSQNPIAAAVQLSLKVAQDFLTLACLLPAKWPPVLEKGVATTTWECWAHPPTPHRFDLGPNCIICWVDIYVAAAPVLKGWMKENSSYPQSPMDSDAGEQMPKKSSGVSSNLSRNKYQCFTDKRMYLFAFWRKNSKLKKIVIFCTFLKGKCWKGKNILLPDFSFQSQSSK